MISFDILPENIVEALKKLNIKEEDLFNHYSDLYVGCNDFSIALELKTLGIWRSTASTFIPNKGSSMEQYPVALEIPFGAMQHHLSTKKVVY